MSDVMRVAIHASPSGARTTAEPVRSTALDRIDVRSSFPSIRGVISICGAASNTGKTWACESVIRGLKRESGRVCALKVTRTHLGDCPRGVATCGTCASVASDFEVVTAREVTDVPQKDTGRYFAAGADFVTWLLVKPAAMAAGIRAALATVPAGAFLVAEGNSFRDFASADVAILALGPDDALKPSAVHVIDRIDVFVSHRAAKVGAPPACVAGRPVVAPGDVWAFVKNRLRIGAPS
jgi:molybdopterin-guanine dinucleotide biosynthesis protein